MRWKQDRTRQRRTWYSMLWELRLSYFSQNCWSPIAGLWGSVGCVSYIISTGRRRSPGHGAVADTWWLLSVPSSLQPVWPGLHRWLPRSKQTAGLKVIAWMPFLRFFWILLTSKNLLPHWRMGILTSARLTFHEAWQYTECSGDCLMKDYQGPELNNIV